MGINLQISFFISIIVLQMVLIAIAVRGFEALQELVNFSKQEVSIAGISDCDKYKDGDKRQAENLVEKGSTEEVNKKNGELYQTPEGEEKRKEELHQTPEGQEFLFVKQLKLDTKEPVAEINITTDKKNDS